MLSRSVRRKRSVQALRAAYRAHAPFFLFPLQLDADSQVRRYSPYSGMKEAIACVLTSFAQSAPSDTHIIIRNHPLDNGLIDYAGFSLPPSPRPAASVTGYISSKAARPTR